MAEARLITKEQLTRVPFLELGPSAKILYVYLVVYADNDGVVNAYQTMKLINSNISDLQILIDKKMIYPVVPEEYVYFLVDFYNSQKLNGKGAAPSTYRKKLLELYPDALVCPLKTRKGEPISDEHGNPVVLLPSHPQK